jgi:hypothetical protein
MTAKQDTLAAIRTLVDYVKEDEREEYLELSATGTGDGHIYESIARIEEWLSGQCQVLYMVAGSDDCCGLPEALCTILTEQEASKRLQMLLSECCLPPIPYNPAMDEVLATYEPSDAMGHRYFGFTPLVAETPTGCSTLNYERPGLPFDSWKVEVNGEVVYQESEEEEGEESLVGSPKAGEADHALAPADDGHTIGS